MGYRWVALVGLLAAGAGLTGCNPAPPECDVVGRWSWFVGGEVDVTRDGQFTQQSGNSGTWECSDAARGEVTFRWRAGGFVNRMVVSGDGTSLTSVDPTQPYVTALRVSAAAPTTPNVAQQVTTAPTTQEPPASSGTAESARLAELINADYSGLVLTLVSKDKFGDNRVIRTLGLELDEGSHLVKRFEECNVGSSADFLSGSYRMSERTHLDCDAQTHDLRWGTRRESIDLETVDVASIVLQGTAEHRTRLSFGYRDNPYALSYLECRNHSACERMVGNFTALLRIAAAPAPAPGIGITTSTKTQSDRAQRIIGLVRSIDAGYAGAQYSFSTLAFKGQSVALEPGFVLTLRALECDGDGNPRYKDLEFVIPGADRNRLLTQLTADCDAKREGLAWTEDLQRFELTKMRDAKFEVLNVTDGGLGTNSIQFSRLQTGVDGFRPNEVVESISTIACKDRRGCEQMAADLGALADAIGMPRGSK